MFKKFLPIMMCFVFISYAGAGDIVLVKGTSSIKNKGELNYAESLANSMNRWLCELNIPFRYVNDEDISSSFLDGAGIVILPYNPYPPRMDALSSFVRKGGKLIVFYSSEPRLADLLGVKLGKYQSTEAYGRWSQLRFNEFAAEDIPRVVKQESRNIRPVLPASSDSRVIAVWADTNGKPGNDTAMAQSPAGFWMSHVLLDDGDSMNKKMLLLGMIASLDPSIYSTVAPVFRNTAGNIGSFGNISRAEKQITKLSEKHPRSGEILELLLLARVAGEQLDPLMKSKKYREVVKKSVEVNDLLTRAYALCQKPSDGEIRAVWNHSGLGLYPGDWKRTCSVLASSGITDVMPNVVWPGSAHYKSDIVSPSKEFAIYGDQLVECLRHAHKNNLRVHVWKVCWRMDKAEQSFINEMRAKNRLQVSASGKTINWLCPSHPENLKLEKDAVRDILKNYDVDGIHLDYVRYTGSDACFCPGCRQRFEQDTGISVKNWPDDARKGSTGRKYNVWRCEQISRFVRDIHAIVKSKRPSIKVSAAVYGKYPSCVDSVGQDWKAWLTKGYLDFACPMNYTSDLSTFDGYLKSQTKHSGDRGKILPGIGATSRECRLSPAQVLDQIQIVRSAGTPGFILFDLNRALETEILSLISPGFAGKN